MAMDRNRLRKRLMDQRQRMGAKALLRAGERIADQVVSHAWYRQAGCVHCFYGLVTKGEVSTLDILRHVMNNGKTLVLPRMLDASGKLRHYQVTDLASLVDGPWGIKEPGGEHADDRRVAPEELDLVLVPGLAADRKGNRIGYGKGYYDRFLKALPNAKTLMLVPEDFILDDIPPREHDVPVRALATEHRIIHCNRNNSCADS